MENPNAMSERAERPIILTIFCILGFIGVPVTLFFLASSEARELLTNQYGPYYVPATLLSSALGLTGLIGMWMMKKWGVYFYTAMAVFSTSVSIYFGIPFSVAYLLPFVVAVIGFLNLKNME